MCKKVLKALCVILVLVSVLSMFGCGKSVNVEGTWRSGDDETSPGYRFDVMRRTTDGEELGSVVCLPQKTSMMSLISYYYRFVDDTTIEILRFSPTSSGDQPYSICDTLKIETEGGERVLVSEKMEVTLYFEKEK